MIELPEVLVLDSGAGSLLHINERIMKLFKKFNEIHVALETRSKSRVLHACKSNSSGMQVIRSKGNKDRCRTPVAKDELPCSKQ